MSTHVTQHHPQHALGLELPEDLSFDHFIGHNNKPTLSALNSLIQSDDDGFIYLFGGQGSGKTYLLQAACQLALNLNKTAMYLSLKSINTSPSLFFDQLEQFDLICLDDLHTLQHQPALEEPLFHLFNRIKTKGKQLITASSCSPRALRLSLADLKSRLNWGLAFRIQTLSDNELINVLQHNAKNAGLNLSNDVCDFLFKRVQRDLAALQAIFQQLNEASFREKRRLTVPFVKDVLGL